MKVAHRRWPVLAVLAAAGCDAGSNSTEAWSDPAPHTVDTVQANGIGIEYLDWGGNGDVLVLIHGFMASPHYFDALASALSDGRRVIAYARRGHGGSEATPPYTVAANTDDLVAFLDALELDRVSLVGWSMGGFEITEFAARHPDRVDKLVYLDAAYDFTDPAWDAARLEFPYDDVPPPSALVSLDAFRAWFQAGYYGGIPWSDALEADLRSTTRAAPDGSIQTVPSPEIIDAYFQGAFAVGSHSVRYADVTAPALAIYAALWLPDHLPDASGRILTWHQDYYRPFRATSIERLRRVMDDPEIIVLDGGSHGTFVHSRSAQVLDAIERFLSTSDSR